MIFCGDFVFPGEFNSKIFKELPQEFLDEPKLVNFEGPVEGYFSKKLTKGIPVSSSDQVPWSLNFLNIKYLSLANNHVFDFDFDVERFKKDLSQDNMMAFGAGDDFISASKPAKIADEKLVILTFGWPVIGCKPAKSRKEGVNQFSYANVENQVVKCKMNYPDRKIICFFHWNYEFELYPQPADRQFCHHLIELGVDGIFGHHSHIIQGFEFYKEKPIFFGLGNFYFPQKNYNGVSLSFPKAALKGLCVKYSEDIYKIKVYITEQVANGAKLKIQETSNPLDCDLLTKISTFRGLSHNEYIKFFKKNRKKKKLLPIYKNYKSTQINNLKSFFVKLRQFPIDFLVRIKKTR